MKLSFLPLLLLISCTKLSFLNNEDVLDVVNELPAQILEDLADDIIDIEEPYNKYLYIAPLFGLSVVGLFLLKKHYRETNVTNTST